MYVPQLSLSVFFSSWLSQSQRVTTTSRRLNDDTPFRPTTTISDSSLLFGPPSSIFGHCHCFGSPPGPGTLKFFQWTKHFFIWFGSRIDSVSLILKSWPSFDSLLPFSTPFSIHRYSFWPTSTPLLFGQSTAGSFRSFSFSFFVDQHVLFLWFKL